MSAAELASALDVLTAQITVWLKRLVADGVSEKKRQSAGYAVFPRIGKIGFIIAGAHGVGEVYETGKLAGTATVSHGTIGLQAGVQEFSQVVFFKDPAMLARFKQNKFEFTANVSAVIVTAGASKAADYRDGVAVFTRATGGAMAEAAIGAQKFSFTAAPAGK